MNRFLAEIVNRNRQAGALGILHEMLQAGQVLLKIRRLQLQADRGRGDASFFVSEQKFDQSVSSVAQNGSRIHVQKNHIRPLSGRKGFQGSLVHGTVDLSVYPDKTDYLHIRFIGTEDSSGTRVNNETGEFRLGGLPKGSYRVRINCWGSSNQSHREGSSAQPVVVDRDVKELKITPVFVSPKKKM